MNKRLIGCITKVNEFYKTHFMYPAMQNHKEFVLSIYPSAYFCEGLIYIQSKSIHPIVNSFFADDYSLESEYYAWMWAAEKIQEEIMEKLSV